MKKLLFLLLFSVGLSSVAQNTSYLDEKNGFKIFSFGDTYTQWKNVLIKDNRPTSLVSQTSGNYCYKYIGESPKELFDVRWKGLYLIFRKDRLVKIEVVFNYRETSQREVLSGLKNVFGSSELSKGVFEYHTWRTENNIMTFQSALPVEYRDGTEEDLTFKLEIENYKILREILDKKKQF